MPRSTFASVSVSALAANLTLARTHARGSFVWAVVKADAYGHGLDVAAEAFADADGLALVEFDRAAQLRAMGVRKPLLMLEGPFDRDDVSTAEALDLHLTIHQAGQIDWLEGHSRGHAGAGFDVCLKLNSGMNRLGFAMAELPEVLARLRAIPAVRSITPMIHFARADEQGRATPVLDAFERRLRDVGLDLGSTSYANSAALLRPPRGRPGMARSVRPGIALYGASPFADVGARDLGLRPAMHFGARLIAVRQLQPGDEVGYGAQFTVSAPMRIGVVACGYADGYPRIARTGTPVAVDGVLTRLVGRVSMDMLTVDLDPVPSARIGSEVELWGSRVPVDDVARCAGTIGYELLCAIAPRVKRVRSD